MGTKKIRLVETEKLVDRLVGVLSSQKRLGEESYPLSLGRLSELADVNAKVVADIAGMKLFKNKIISARRITKKQSDAEIPVALIEDIERLAAAPLTIEFILKFRRSDSIQAFTISELSEKLSESKDPAKNVRKRFKQSMDKRVKEGISVSNRIAWIMCRKPKLFFCDDIRPSSFAAGKNLRLAESSAPKHDESTQPMSPLTAPNDEFKQKFAATFDRIDRLEGNNNFVSLVDLRRELADFSRVSFDRNIQALRRTGRYTLIAAQGRDGGLRPEEAEAAIEEAGKHLLFVSRI